jgi:hypothetical protein
MTTPLSPMAEELLALRLSGKANRSLPPRSSRRPALSFAQERLWFISKLMPTVTAYNVPVAYRLRGALDVEALARSLARIVARHEALRTRYAEDVDGPFQAIDPPGAFRLTHDDVSSCDDPPEYARRAVAADADTPFDPARDPLFRARLIRLAPGDHVLAMVVHHSVFDRQSLDILTAELSACYSAFTAGLEPALAPLPAQYATFSEWQRERLTDTVMNGHLDFWRERLDGAPFAVELPTDFERSPTPSFRAGVIDEVVPPAVARGLRELAARMDATLFMVTIAAYQAVLARYTSNDDVVVGCPVNGRARREFEGLIGFFASSMPVRARLAGDPPFHRLVAEVKAAMLASYAHHELPFARLVDGLDVPRDLSRNPLFQLWFDLITVRSTKDTGVLDLHGPTVEPFETDRAYTRFDTELYLTESPTGSLSGRLYYATDLFERGTMTRFFGHYLNFLREVAHDPNRRLSQIPILGSAEQQQIIGRWGTAS